MEKIVLRSEIDLRIGEVLLEDSAASMKQKLAEKNTKIENLCILLEALQAIPGINPEKIKKVIEEDGCDGVDFRDAKIVALAKKSHHLTMTVNKQRCLNEEINVKFHTLKANYDLLQQQESSKQVSEVNYGRHSKMENSAENNEVVMSRQLKEFSKNVEDLKRKNTQLFEDNKNLTKVLSRELGDGTSLEQAVDGGWRGRAQQIIMLKAKVGCVDCFFKNYFH